MKRGTTDLSTRHQLLLVLTLGASAVITMAIALSPQYLSAANDDVSVVIEKGDGVCLAVDTMAPEILSIEGAERLGMDAETFDLRLQLSGKEENVSLSFNTIRKSTTVKSGTYFGQCEFTDGPLGLKVQENGFGSCSALSSTIYHSKPGSRSTMIVRCRSTPNGSCSMTLFDEVGPINVTIGVAMQSKDPATWSHIAENIRDFIDERVSYLPEC